MVLKGLSTLLPRAHVQTRTRDALAAAVGPDLAEIRPQRSGPRGGPGCSTRDRGFPGQGHSAVGVAAPWHERDLADGSYRQQPGDSRRWSTSTGSGWGWGGGGTGAACGFRLFESPSRGRCESDWCRAGCRAKNGRELGRSKGCCRASGSARRRWLSNLYGDVRMQVCGVWCFPSCCIFPPPRAPCDGKTPLLKNKLPNVSGLRPSNP